ncbi:MAG: benzoate/H(+) symporter BenE family transporter [Deltaproteobacteria bacterium]|nr:benzoate/H(+) symporter BenE family transporter [Deltaproteobacteria bacterium]
MNSLTFVRDLNGAALWAGLTTFVWFASGMVPLQIAVSSELGLDPAQSSSSIFIVWLSAALSSIVLSSYYRQPIPITWTIPGLIYLGTLAGQFTFSELVGANLMAGFLIVVLGLLGIGGRIMDWIPLPVVMGMFAGSILSYVTRMVKATVEDLSIAGSTVAGYLLGKLIGSPRVPPMGLAIILGGSAVFLTRQIASSSVSWGFPALVIPEIDFSLSAFIAVSLPMLVLSMVLGNVQGLGFLLAQGYPVPVKPVTVLVGLSSIVNAMLGGYPAIVGRTAVAILAAPDAGPASGRYVGSLLAAALTVTLALAASPVTSFIAILPHSYVLVLAGLAILSSLQEAFERAFNSRLRFGALIAFVVAATPFTIAGITAAFWAIVAGLVGSLLAERSALQAYWREKGFNE